MPTHRNEEALSLAMRPEDGIKPPFTAEELLELGKQYARVEGVPAGLREDAAQEFAIAGWQAMSKPEHQGNVRAFQIQAGKWAVKDLLRREQRDRSHDDSGRQRFADMLSCHDECSAESVADASSVDPLEQLIAQEEGARAMAQLEKLPVRERRVVEEVVLRGRPQEDVATDLGISQWTVSNDLRMALQKLRGKIL